MDWRKSPGRFWPGLGARDGIFGHLVSMMSLEEADMFMTPADKGDASGGTSRGPELAG